MISKRKPNSSANGHLTPKLLTELRQAFHANPAYKLAMNAVTQTSVDDVALNRDVVTNTDFTFSHWLDDWAVYAAAADIMALTPGAVESLLVRARRALRKALAGTAAELLEVRS